MRHEIDTECHYDVKNGIVWFSCRGKAEVVAKFDSDIKAEAYLEKLLNSKSKSKRKPKKTSGKYEQKKRSVGNNGRTAVKQHD